jgi:hypothetical protein
MFVFVACLFLATLFNSLRVFLKKKKKKDVCVVFGCCEERRERHSHQTETQQQQPFETKKKEEEEEEARASRFIFSLSLSSPVRLNRTTGPSSPHRFEACAPRQRRSLRLVLFSFPLYVGSIWGKQ